MTDKKYTVEYVNKYYCEECDVVWEDVADSSCDDECPECGRHYSPGKSERIVYEE